MNGDARLQRLWYGPAWHSLPLWPLAWMFRAIVGIKSGLYRIRLLNPQHVAVPVVVVGNLTVGGTGKTPIAAWIAQQFTLRGHRAGVVLRGYGGRHRGGARLVTVDDDPDEVGDEALLHARREPHVVVIGADRVAAAERAVAEGAEVVVCDDGLQHLRLARDYEIAVVDAERGFGNGRLLPAGPLREPAGRLETVDAVVLTEREDRSAMAPIHPRHPLVATVRFRLGEAVNLRTGERRRLETFRGRPLHAVAAIGHPDAFFAGLRATGLDVTVHPLPDHGTFVPAAAGVPADATVLMTEKDAVKCRGLEHAGWWWVDLETGFDRSTAHDLITRVLERTGLTGAGVRLG